MNIYKIAIPQINGQVNPHFGQSASFAIIEINGQDVVNVRELSTAGLAHQHDGLAAALKGQGVETVVVGGIGSGAALSLQQAGLKLLTGASGEIRSVASAVAKGMFVSQRTMCNHGECGGKH